MMVLMCELGALWLMLEWLGVARGFSQGPAAEACKGLAMLVLPVLLLSRIVVVAVVDAADAVAAGYVFVADVFAVVVAVDAAVSLVAVPTILPPPPLLPSQRSCR